MEKQPNTSRTHTEVAYRRCRSRRPGTCPGARLGRSSPCIARSECRTCSRDSPDNGRCDRSYGTAPRRRNIGSTDRCSRRLQQQNDPDRPCLKLNYRVNQLHRQRIITFASFH